MTPNKGYGPQFGETVYISEVNEAMKIKSDAQVAINQNADLVQNFFLRGGWEDSAPDSKFSKFLKLSETSPARKLILGLQVNIDKANSRRYDTTR